MGKRVFIENPEEEPFKPVKELVRQWAEEVTETAGEFDDCYGCNLEEVANRPYDGFVPYTDGGWNGVAYGTLKYAYSSGSAPEAIQPYIDSEIKDAEKDWNEENPEHTIEWIYADDETQGDLLGKSKEREHWKGKWHEFEDQYFEEGGTYFYKVRALFFGPNNSRNESGEPEVYLMVGLNTDFEYGRDSIPWLACYGQKTKMTEWPWECTVKVKDVTPELVEQLTRDAMNSLRTL
jgi:hypothetical protein